MGVKVGDKYLYLEGGHYDEFPAYVMSFETGIYRVSSISYYNEELGKLNVGMVQFEEKPCPPSLAVSSKWIDNELPDRKDRWIKLTGKTETEIDLLQMLYPEVSKELEGYKQKNMGID